MKQLYELKGEGRSIRAIARDLGVSRNSVRKYLRSPQVPRAKEQTPRGSKLDPYKEYLTEPALVGQILVGVDSGRRRGRACRAAAAPVPQVLAARRRGAGTGDRRVRPGPCHLQGDRGGPRRPYPGRERRAGPGKPVHLHRSGGGGGRHPPPFTGTRRSQASCIQADPSPLLLLSYVAITAPTPAGGSREHRYARHSAAPLESDDRHSKVTLEPRSQGVTGLR